MMNLVIDKSLKNSFTYIEYRDFVTNLVSENKTSGHNQSDELIHYTKLNEARLHRLDKTIKVVDEVKLFFENLSKKYIWLVISESWCGDAAQILPILNKMSEISEKIEFRIVLRDDHEDLMNLFLTNGTKSIPKLLIIDKETNEVIVNFGPRPEQAKQLLLDYKTKHGVVDEAAKIDLQKWYLHDKGISTQTEILELMRKTI